jgi:Protein of unknown function (DUF2844)
MSSRLGLRIWMLSSIVAFTALWPGLASATLGEPESSVQTDSERLQGSIKESDLGNYRVHEIKLPSGTLVREYAGSDGQVFAVAWNGPFIPNMRQTLGSYFDSYAAAAKGQRTDHRHLQIELKNLVVQASGHMRAWSGRAYLPQAIPAGVSIGDLK